MLTDDKIMEVVCSVFKKKTFGESIPTTIYVWNSYNMMIYDGINYYTPTTTDFETLTEHKNIRDAVFHVFKYIVLPKDLRACVLYTILKEEKQHEQEMEDAKR